MKILYSLFGFGEMIGSRATGRLVKWSIGHLVNWSNSQLISWSAGWLNDRKPKYLPAPVIKRLADLLRKRVRATHAATESKRKIYFCLPIKIH